MNASYQVVIPRDAVAGVPADYADQVIDNTLAIIATVAQSEDIASCSKR